MLGHVDPALVVGGHELDEERAGLGPGGGLQLVELGLRVAMSRVIVPSGTGWSIQAIACPVSLAGSAPMSSSRPTMYPFSNC